MDSDNGENIHPLQIYVDRRQYLATYSRADVEWFQTLNPWFLIHLVVRYVHERVLKGHICPASQTASHIQVNPSVYEGSLFMYCTTTAQVLRNSLG